jgi:hypothetical protein
VNESQRRKRISQLRKSSSATSDDLKANKINSLRARSPQLAAVAVCVVDRISPRHRDRENLTGVPNAAATPSYADIDRYLKVLLAEKKPSGDAFEPAPKIEEGSAC